MFELLMPLLNISVAIFMAGNLFDMGLRLDASEALRGLRHPRFIALTLLWGFILVPALAWGIAHLMPLDAPYALGLILMGLAPCAPFTPVIVAKGNGDMGFTAAFMLITAIGTVLFMPLAVPMLIAGLSVSAWSVARPLLVMVLIPLFIGMAIRRASAARAKRLLSPVKKVTLLATLAVVGLCIVLFGKGLLSLGGTFAIASQVLFFAIVSALTYWTASGLRHEERIVLSVGMTTRNIGAALAALMAFPETDQRAVIMIVLGLVLMVLFAGLAVKLSGRSQLRRRPPG